MLRFSIVSLVSLVLSISCGASERSEATTPAARGSVSVAPAAASEVPADPRMVAMLDAHASRRSAHCAPPLVWSETLAAHAQAWADHLAESGCALEHSTGGYGENLAAGTAGSLTPEEYVEMWYREADGYSFASGGFSMETGHFTQLVWVASERLGCGVTTCGGLDVWVCNYDPPGNFEGQYRENVLPTSCR